MRDSISLIKSSYQSTPQPVPCLKKQLQRFVPVRIPGIRWSNSTLVLIRGMSMDGATENDDGPQLPDESSKPQRLLIWLHGLLPGA